MKKNLSGLERIVRLLLGAIIVVLYLTHIMHGTLGIVMLVIGILLIITSLIGFSPLYTLLSINDDKKNSKKK